MKVWKKNLVAAAVLVTVCAGIYVNWLYTEENAAASLADTLDVEKVMSDETLVLSEDMAAIAGGLLSIFAKLTISSLSVFSISRRRFARLL